MSKNQTVIIVRNPDSEIPEEYLRKALKFANCGGYAVQCKAEDGSPMLLSEQRLEKPDFDGLSDFLKGTKNHRVLLALSHLEKVDKSFIQPFDFTMKGEDQPLLCFAMEGEFTTMADAKTTSERFLADNTILPSFEKFLKLSEGKLENFLAEVNDPTFVDNIVARIGDRGEFVFLPPEGEVITKGKNKLASFFPWGWVSNTLGYKEVPPKAEAVAEAPKKTGWWAGKRPNTGEAPVETKPAVPARPEGLPPEEPSVVKDPPPSTPTPQDTTKPPEGEWKEVPRGLSTKERKKFIRRVTNCGNNLPDGWEKLDFKYWAPAYASAPKEIQALAEKFNTRPPKDMRSSEAPKIVDKSTVVEEVNTFVLTAEEKSSAETSILKIMDRGGKEIPAPTEIQKMEKKYPNFTSQFGVTNDQIDSWTPKDIEFFAKENGKAFFHMFLEVRRDRIDAYAQLAKLSNTEKPVEPVKIEAPVPAPEPEKKVAGGGWGWKK